MKLKFMVDFFGQKATQLCESGIESQLRVQLIQPTGLLHCKNELEGAISS
jgi:hypothetical protein